MRSESERAYQEGGDVGALQTMVHPEDVDKPISEQRLAFGRMDQGRMQALRDAAGKIFSASQSQAATSGLQNIKERLSERIKRRRPREITTGELRYIATSKGPDAAEEIANDMSFKAGGAGGRIEVYAGGAMEWVPNGPGGVPQPTVGDVFYDPIREAQELQEIGVSGEDYKKFARGGIVNGYQNGGDVDLDVSEEIVERTTHPGAGQTLTGIILQGRQDALDRLKAGQARIEERRARQQKQAQQDKWFALAQGMLAPTQTGGFGESVGTTAGLMQQQSQMAANQEMALEEQEMESQARQDEIEAQMIDQLLEQETIAARSASASDKDIHGRIQTMVKPEDQGKPMEEQELVFGVALKGLDGQWRMEPLKNDAGNYQIAADRLEPARAAALVEAGERAKIAEQRSQGMIQEGYAYKSPLIDIRRANEIFENADTIIKTSGVQALKNRLANFVGADFGDTVELTELQMVAAQDYLGKLSDLKGPASDKDLAEMKGISVTIGNNATANYRQLKKMEKIYSQGVKRGLREAWKTGDRSALGDLWEDASGNVYHPGLPFITTKDQYDKLPPGSYFYKVSADTTTGWGDARRFKPEEE